MFKSHKTSHKRSSNPLFVIFRLLLSLIIFGILVLGSYYAYRQFSGYDPLKISPDQFLKQLTSKEALISSFFDLLSIGSKTVSNTTENDISEDYTSLSQIPSEEDAPKSPLSFKFAIVADSHSDSVNLDKALQMAKAQGVEFIIGLGDYTDIGTIDELQQAKVEFDKTGIRYFSTAGDHDLWDGRDKKKDPITNYQQIFGPPYQSFSFEGVRFLIIYNSDNYLGLGTTQKNWINQELQKVMRDPEIKLKLAFTHEPLSHPSGDHFMGKVTPDLRDEAIELGNNLKKAGFAELFAGDTHFFTRVTDQETGLKMTTIGAVTSLRNPQLPRFGIISVYENGEYRVEDVEIN
jgi:predicted phosphodiesterase